MVQRKKRKNELKERLGTKRIRETLLSSEVKGKRYEGERKVQ